METQDSDVELNPKDRELLNGVLKMNDDEIVELLRDLRSERHLEYQIYASREQWMWVLWTASLAAAIVGLTSPNAAVRMGVTLVTGCFAYWIAQKREPGLLASFEALNLRHRWTVAITDDKRLPDQLKVRLAPLGFGSRLLTRSDGSRLDITHVQGFQFPLGAKSWTIALWIGLLAVSVVSLAYDLVWKSSS